MLRSKRSQNKVSAVLSMRSFQSETTFDCSSDEIFIDEDWHQVAPMCIEHWDDLWVRHNKVSDSEREHQSHCDIPFLLLKRIFTCFQGRKSTMPMLILEGILRVREPYWRMVLAVFVGRIVFSGFEVYADFEWTGQFFRVLRFPQFKKEKHINHKSINRIMS